VRTLAAAVEGWAAHLTPDGQVLEVWPKARRGSARQAAEEVRHTGLVQQALTVVQPGQLRDLTVRGDLGTLGHDAVDLGPILDYTRADLVRSVVAYLRHRGHWEDAARDLGIHRNTLRHRIGTARRVLDADLDDPDVASRLWLALRAAGLA